MYMLGVAWSALACCVQPKKIGWHLVFGRATCTDPSRPIRRTVLQEAHTLSRIPPSRKDKITKVVVTTSSITLHYEPGRMLTFSTLGLDGKAARERLEKLEACAPAARVMKKSLLIAVDFDGTVCGRPVPGRRQAHALRHRDSERAAGGRPPHHSCGRTAMANDWTRLWSSLKESRRPTLRRQPLLPLKKGQPPQRREPQDPRRPLH